MIARAMDRRAFSYALPEHLIAQHPLARRTASRLLCLDASSGAIADRRFIELPSVLRSGDLLVLNDTRVLRARLYGRKQASGGRVEILIERLVNDHEAWAQIRSGKPACAGGRIALDAGPAIEVLGRNGDLHRIRCGADQTLMAIMEQLGHVPLPPYIRRPDAAGDTERYQTVFARRPGAVAAPTAGLHFDAPLLTALRVRGVGIGFLTLHVGAGTFQPVRSDRIEDHRMHRESFELGEALCRQVAATRAGGGRVVAVGTTAVRALESAAAGGTVCAGAGETEIFIYPGYRFWAVDAIITNFHLPESTLLMLVCAFAGRERVLEAYRHAVRHGYRFFSYGDAMLVSGRAL
ncbi:MAG: tRNA preQ1(34) S-adenosylmethionine ribosyltransferase-isomerase QueA [Gammaproteobacteria bacterium]